MITKLASLIFQKLKKDGAVEESLSEAYLYGIEVGLANLFGLLLALGIGLIAGRFVVTLFFLLCFVPLRRFSGGFHAQKFWHCSVLTTVVIILALILQQYLVIPEWAAITVFAMAAILVFYLAPIENANKRLDGAERKRYKWTAFIILMLEAATAVLMYYYVPRIYCTVVIAVFFTILLMVFDLLKKGGKSDEGCFEDGCENVLEHREEGG